MANVGHLAELVRRLGGLVVWVTHAIPPGGHGDPPRRPRMLPKSGSAEAALAVEPDHRDSVVAAAGINGFYGSALDDVLRAQGRYLLVMAGLGLETVVHSTLRGANDRGYECVTVTDAAAPEDLALAASALSSICMSGGIFGAVADSRAVEVALRQLDPSLTPSPANAPSPSTTPNSSLTTTEFACPSPS